MKIASEHHIATAPTRQDQALNRKAGMDAHQDMPKGSAVTSSDSGGRLPGVLRLLQEGHFKGVADVRLRINFHEQLQGLQGEALRERAPDAVEAFLAELNKEVDALKLDETQTPKLYDLLEEFSGKAKGLVGNDSKYTIDSLLKALRDEFGTLLEKLQNIVNGDAPAPSNGDNESLGDTVVSEESGEVGPSSSQALSDLASSLENLFNDLIAGLENDLKQASAILPPLSPPQGNGKAYAKFLAILEGLNATGASDPETGIDGLV
jgi:hypothetical protein